jgi:hypothetical protein
LVGLAAELVAGEWSWPTTYPPVNTAAATAAPKIRGFFTMHLFRPCRYLQRYARFLRKVWEANEDFLMIDALHGPDIIETVKMDL